MPVLATDVVASSAPYRRARTRMQTLLAEVTDLPRYYNLALATRPYAQWSHDERDPAARR